MTKKNLKVALAQISPILADPDKNIQKHLEYIERAVTEKADIILFPELSATSKKNVTHMVH